MMVSWNLTKSKSVKPTNIDIQLLKNKLNELIITNGKLKKASK